MDDTFDPPRDVTQPFPYERPTEDERLLQSFADVEEAGMDSWRIFRIMGEFVEGFEEMSDIGTGVSIFGSARATPDDPMYQACVETARQLGEAGFPIITGGGPGMMEAANKGAQLASVPSVGCNIELPFEQAENPFLDVSIDFRYFFVRKTMFVKYACAFVVFPGASGPWTSFSRPSPSSRPTRFVISQSSSSAPATGRVSSTGSGPPCCRRVRSLRRTWTGCS